MILHNEHHFSCPSCSTDQLEQFVNRTLPSEEWAAVEAHLIDCAVCQEEVAARTELRRLMGDVSARTPEPRADLFALIEQRLDRAPAPAPLSRLHTLFSVCRLVYHVGGAHLLTQARLLRRDLFWMPLFIIPLVISLVYLPRPWQQITPGTAALLAALLTAFSMAFLYGQRADPAREVVLVTPTSPRLVLAVRCCLVFGYDLLLNCGLVLPFLTLQGVVTPAWFLTNWLAPLVCLSAIALLLSILVNASVAVLVCVLLWTLRLLNTLQALWLGSIQPLPTAPWQQLYESFWHQGPLLFVVALLFLILSFGFLERKERFTR